MSLLSLRSVVCLGSRRRGDLRMERFDGVSPSLKMSWCVFCLTNTFDFKSKTSSSVLCGVCGALKNDR